MLARVTENPSAFRRLFGQEPAVSVSAPGRVNLIGEHTDYNDGFVLPTAIPQRARLGLSRRDDGVARVYAREMNETLEYRPGEEAAGRGWLDYVQGVTWVLRGLGYEPGGFDAAIESDVPVGSGLSSSAALLVAALRGLRELHRLPIDDVEVARLAQRAENEFVGARVGIMDQMASSLADAGSALFLDARTLEFERVPLPAGAELVVLNSGVEHSNVGGDYNTRRAESERAAELLGVVSLRELRREDLTRLSALPEPFGRRARHVLTENGRVLEAVEAMRQNDLPRLGALFYASHDSMRDDYEVSVPEIDLIVNLARGHADVFGARLTGGGFGGSVLMLAREGAGRRVGLAVAEAYAAQSGRTPTLLVPAG